MAIKHANSAGNWNWTFRFVSLCAYKSHESNALAQLNWNVQTKKKWLEHITNGVLSVSPCVYHTWILNTYIICVAFAHISDPLKMKMKLNWPWSVAAIVIKIDGHNAVLSVLNADVTLVSMLPLYFYIHIFFYHFQRFFCAFFSHRAPQLRFDTNIFARFKLALFYLLSSILVECFANVERVLSLSRLCFNAFNWSTIIIHLIWLPQKWRTDLQGNTN